MKKILVATNHLNSIGGSEMYTYYLIKALKKDISLEVEYFTFQKGEVSERIETELGVHFKTGSHYDLILASHNTTVAYLYGQGPIVQVSHGTVPPLEQPIPLASAHIAVSDEIAHHLKSLGYDSKVILNGVDLEVFDSNLPVNNTVETILSLCQSDEANNLIGEVCREKDIEFLHHNKYSNPNFDISEEINNADMVIGVGRSAYDAMACGRPVILFDNRSYNGNKGDGYLKPSDFLNFAKYNCSGRYKNKPLNKALLAQEIEKYDPKDGLELRKIAEKHLAIDINASNILEFGFQIQEGNNYAGTLGRMVNYLQNKKHFNKLKKDLRHLYKERLIKGEKMETLESEISSQKFPFQVKLALQFFIRKQNRKMKRE
ncbi:glycosyltransferase family protein [Litoribacter populi]|uniref:glycosyltransferase family 4 protein n=1 Tax=Litoribacter populi TaxID=2598460 RepID=UPI00117D21D2|nr:glycosyltransferase family 4 protein [Litoribacter populi]